MKLKKILSLARIITITAFLALVSTASAQGKSDSRSNKGKSEEKRAEKGKDKPEEMKEEKGKGKPEDKKDKKD